MITTSIVAYLALFVAAGFAFLFGALLLGWFLRPRRPSWVKSEIYECGERSVGTSHVRFDLRFYVVALVFLIFDVEVAFFFPWAAVFGNATSLMRPDPTKAEATADARALPLPAEKHLRGLGVSPVVAANTAVSAAACGEAGVILRQDGRTLALAAMADMGVFFGVLMVGFVYVWYRGDLDWIRAISPTARREGADD